MKTPYSGTAFYATLLNVPQNSVTHWCQKGLLKSTRYMATGNYVISTDSFVDFLYANPNYRKQLEEFSGSVYENTVRDQVLVEVYKRKPVLCTVGDIAQICNVTEETVRYWVKSKHLKSYRFKSSINRYLVSLEDFEQFVRYNPQYRNYYTDYIRGALKSAGTN